LVVERMREHYRYREEGGFSDEEAERIVQYLVAHPFNAEHYRPRFPEPVLEPQLAVPANVSTPDEISDTEVTTVPTDPDVPSDSISDPEEGTVALSVDPSISAPSAPVDPEMSSEEPTVPDTEAVEPEAETAVTETEVIESEEEVIAVLPDTVVPVDATAGMEQPSVPISPDKATKLAKDMGYVAVAALVLMIVTGAIRRTMGRSFRKVHCVLAFILCVTLTIHSAVFLAEYGIPSVLWFWFGIIATVILLAVVFSGLLHLKNRKYFVRYHIAVGVAGLFLTAAHWVWIYI